MKKIPDAVIKDVEECLAKLVEGASNDVIRTKLRNFHDICKAMVTRSEERLSIPEVLRRYEGRFPDPSLALSESTVRNKRAGGNPYLALYRKWVEAAESIVASSSRNAVRKNGGIIGEDEIRSIEDPVLRHQIVMLFAQNRSLFNQLNILKQENTDRPLQLEGHPSTQGAADLVLTEAEVDAVVDFIDERKLRAKHLSRTDEHGVTLKDGRSIADAGFVTALEKIARSYRPA